MEHITKTRKDLYYEFLKKLDKAPSLSDDVIAVFTENYYSLTDAQKKLYDRMKNDAASYDTPADFFRENYDEYVRFLCRDKKECEIIYTYMNKLNRFQYYCGWDRRTMRTSAYLNCIPNIRGILQTAFYLRIFNCSPADYLLDRMTPEMLDIKKNEPHELSALDNVIAAYLDAGDREVKDAVISIITADNNVAFLTVDIIRAVFKCNDPELHELLGKLLVAARLSEGLRQSICESMDCGTIESFRTMFDVIKDNDLLRYSSVKRAVASFIGMVDTEHLTRSSNKTFHLMDEVVHDKTKAYALIDSRDTVSILVGLWGLGVYEVNDAFDEIEKIAQHGNPEQKKVAAFYARMTGYPGRQQKAACCLLETEDLDLPLAAIILDIHSQKWMVKAAEAPEVWFKNGIYEFKEPHPMDLSEFFADEKEAKRYIGNLTRLLGVMDQKKYEFDPCVFPWNSERITRSDVMLCIVMAANSIGDKDIMDEYAERLAEFDSSTRGMAAKLLLLTPDTERRRKALIAALGDKESMTRAVAKAAVKKLTLTDAEYEEIEKLLRFKAGDLRMNAVSLLSGRDEKGFRQSVSNLLSDKNAEMRLGGLDLLKQKKEGGADISEFRSLVNGIAAPGEREKVLIADLYGEEAPAEELYTDADIIEIPKADYEPSAYPLFSYPAQKLREAFQKLDDLIEEHKYDEYVSAYGEKVALGANRNLPPLKDSYIQRERVPFLPLWDAFYEEYIADPDLLIAMLLSICGLNIVPEYYNVNVEVDPDYCRFVREMGEKIFGFAVVHMDFSNLRYCRNSYPNVATLCCAILEALKEKYCDQKRTFLLGKRVCEYVVENTPESRRYTKVVSPYFEELYSIMNANMIHRGASLLSADWNTPDEYKEMFRLSLILQNMLASCWDCHSYNVKVGILDYVYAAYLGEITEAQMFRMLFESGHLKDHFDSLFRILYRKDLRYAGSFLYKLSERNPEFRAYLISVADRAADLVVSTECRRGDSPTKYSNAVTAIKYIRGLDRLCALLRAMENEKFYRYAYEVVGEKNENLSHLISVCNPGENDTAEAFARAMKELKISEKRLIELAMYSPGWIDLIEGYLGYKGLKSGAYYFMAHMNDAYSQDERKFAQIARFTPLEKEELFNGAFDIAWFKEAYASLGEEKFMLLYDAAKYVSDGSKHTRARKYADAVLGKLDPDKMEEDITAKRNKDTLMAYALLPYTDKAQLLHRYEFIQAFKKQSSQFGSMRQASEKTAADVALRNLATVAGYADVTRLTLAMEADLARSLSGFFEMRDIDENAQSGLRFNDAGKTELVFIKKGKELASVPAAYKKNEYILQLKEVNQKFTEQYRRTVRMLEQSMEDRELYSYKEILEMLDNPVISALIKNTVFVCTGAELEGRCGLIGSGFLDVSGNAIALDDGSMLRVAHPFDLYREGKWHEWQKLFFDRSIRQAFRQVFRELYLKLEEELERSSTRMFAGNQIQVQKTLAVLKKRRWIAEYEDGLQKIFYKDDLAVELYALADWFSPSDIEPPTLEYVAFTNRRTGEPVKLKDVPDIAFSEAMRDTDLAVSVAHAGGVDPETSHSSIEMRKVIVERNIELFKLSNVKVQGTHAFIQGKYGEYSVHLGSGVVMMMGVHQINILPVHSQYRGRIFLPFLDEDPKTSEIVSKIVLLSEDKKIKDPYILEQMH